MSNYTLLVKSLCQKEKGRDDATQTIEYLKIPFILAFCFSTFYSSSPQLGETNTCHLWLYLLWTSLN